MKSYIGFIFLSTATPSLALFNSEQVSWPVVLRASQQNSSLSGIPLRLFLISSFGGLVDPMLGAFVMEGSQFALGSIKSSSKNILKNYDLTLEIYNDDCFTQRSISIVTKFLNSVHDGERNDNETLPLLLGPMCSGVDFNARTLPHYNFVGISLWAPPFGYYFGLMPAYKMLYDALPVFLVENGWRRIFFISDYLRNHLEETLFDSFQRRYNISLAGYVELLFDGINVPLLDYNEDFARLASMEPRIIIVETELRVMVACLLHKFQLYGPQFVIVVAGPYFFQPGDQPRLPNCTDQMIFEVLKSVMYFSYGKPIELEPEAEDSLGISGRKLDDYLKRRIPNVEQNSQYFFFRELFYSQLLATAVVLNDTETELRGRNLSLADWYVSGSNFRRNGKTIMGILRQNAQKLRVNTPSFTDKHPITSSLGLNVLYQVQTTGSVDEWKIHSRTVPVQLLDTSLPNAKLQHARSPLIWSTGDGLPPTDSVIKIRILTPLIELTPNVAISTLAAVILVGNIIFIVAIWCKKCSTKADVIHGLGNVMLATSVLMLPKDALNMAGILCMATSFTVVLGLNFVTLALTYQLHLVHKKMFELSRSSNLNRAIPLERIVKPRNTAQRNSSNRHVKAKKALISRSLRSKFGRFGIFWIFLQLSLMIAWFTTEPLETTMFDRQNVLVHASLSEQSFTYACKLRISNVSTGFIAILISCYLLLFLRSVFRAYGLRKFVASVNGDVTELNIVRVASYSMGSLAIAGSGLIAAIYSTGDPGNLTIGIAALIIVFTLSSSIFAGLPKLIEK